MESYHEIVSGISKVMKGNEEVFPKKVKESYKTNFKEIADELPLPKKKVVQSPCERRYPS